VNANRIDAISSVSLRGALRRLFTTLHASPFSVRVRDICLVARQQLAITRRSEWPAICLDLFARNVSARAETDKYYSLRIVRNRLGNREISHKSLKARNVGGEASMPPRHGAIPMLEEFRCGAESLVMPRGARSKRIEICTTSVGREEMRIPLSETHAAAEIFAGEPRLAKLIRKRIQPRRGATSIGSSKRRSGERQWTGTSTRTYECN